MHERLRLLQWVAIGFATAGVLYLTLAYGHLPWIALTLGFTFSSYGLVKKMAPLGSLFGLMLETGILLVPALVYLLYSDGIGQGAFLHAGAISDMLLIGTGLVTAVPLLMFAAAAPRIPLSQLGVSPVYRADTAIPTWRNGLQRTVYTLPVHRLCQCMGRADHFCD